MSVGMVVLVVVSILIFLGIAQRVLDKLRLSDKAAIAVIIAIIAATIFIPDLRITENVFINIGGFVIPAALAFYLFVKAETGKEKSRAVIAAAAAGIIIYLAQRYVLPAEPEAQLVDPNYVYPVLGGLTAYILGRSRRAAFVAGIFGIVISDMIQLVINAVYNIPAPTRFGGAGGLDTTFLTGILAVILAEIIGEIREKLQGGTSKKDMHFDKGHFVSTLGEEKKEDIINDIKRGDEDEK